MPMRDGTGPLGKGPLTGSGLGMCIVSNYNIDSIRSLGRGSFCRHDRCGYRYGLGGMNVDEETTSERRKKLLHRHRDALKARLEAIEKQLEK